LQTFTNAIYDIIYHKLNSDFFVSYCSISIWFILEYYSSMNQIDIEQ